MADPAGCKNLIVFNIKQEQEFDIYMLKLLITTRFADTLFRDQLAKLVPNGGSSRTNKKVFSWKR